MGGGAVGRGAGWVRAAEKPAGGRMTPYAKRTLFACAITAAVETLLLVSMADPVLLLFALGPVLFLAITPGGADRAVDCGAFRVGRDRAAGIPREAKEGVKQARACYCEASAL